MKKKESKEVSQKTTVKKKASTKKQVKKYKSPTWKEVFDSHVLPPLPPVLPKLIELWGLNVQTTVQSKKNLDQLTAK